MDDDVTFGPVSDVQPAGDDRLSVLEAGLRAQQRLNDRVERIGLPEKIAWQFDVTIPSDGGFLATLATASKKRAKAMGRTGEEGLIGSAMILARYCVGILHGGDYAVDARTERASAFADPALLQRLGAKDSVEAVLKLVDSDVIVAGLGDKVMELVTADDAEVETVEDPTAGD